LLHGGRVGMLGPGMSDFDQGAERTAQARAKSRRERAGQIFTFALGGLAVLFAVLNLDQVKVNWIVGT